MWTDVVLPKFYFTFNLIGNLDKFKSSISFKMGTFKSKISWTFQKSTWTHFRKVLNMGPVFWHSLYTAHWHVHKGNNERQSKKWRSPQCRADYPLLACSCSFNSHISPPRYEALGSVSLLLRRASLFLSIYLFFLNVFPVSNSLPPFNIILFSCCLIMALSPIAPRFP